MWQSLVQKGQEHGKQGGTETWREKGRETDSETRTMKETPRRRSSGSSEAFCMFLGEVELSCDPAGSKNMCVYVCV